MIGNNKAQALKIDMKYDMKNALNKVSVTVANIPMTVNENGAPAESFARVARISPKPYTAEATDIL